MAELGSGSGRRGEASGYGDARRRRRWFSGEREREQGEKRRARESESGAGQLRGFVRGIEGVRGSRRWPRQHRRAPRLASARPPGRGGRGQGGGGGLGRLATGVGQLGRLQVSGPGSLSLSLFSNYFSFLFCRFVLNLVLKPIQFILLLTIFLGAKRIKTMLHKIFQNYWTYIYLIVDINPIQIIIDLIQMPKLNVSETPKILVWILPLANISRG